MPMGAEPVYQPTTVSVSYEPRPGRNNSRRALACQMLSSHRFQLMLLFFGLLCLASGISIVAGTIVSHIYGNNDTNDFQSDDDAVIHCAKLPLSMIVSGAFFILIGLFCLGVYITVADWRRNCVVCQCPLFDKKKSLARQLHSQNGGGCSEGIMALNPSTDPLVSHTQYAPVSELPHRGDEEERRNLMPDNKDCLSSAEESDRMLEPDPRIVLRPMGRLDDA
ncbi:PREDICTED: uncharacterized protein LOC108368388 [Rhagoletis zephyria]|uniref:uncharacterized protein LOC108368388 n=1 Tax=Rhagoletis zephyria TaxID=28612 RepID=UPI0008113120|nr:PREDICTED: uncharacterized protein LOC108368388 [Rhagoletis zephyria]XP_017478731.1 PREDICTED: uncharacterized protein LOC108368388 [Rhagoletis zephyria]XP_017478732.1 PREDICTED: uncharacterized protein LOC108368388 [Rhagoletis zephyria]